MLHEMAENCPPIEKVSTERPNLFSLEEFQKLDGYFVKGGFNDPIFDKLSKDIVDYI